LENAEKNSSTGTVEGIVIISHGDLEGFYFGKGENQTGFTKTGIGSSGKKYSRISDLQFPESTIQIEMLSCRSATGCVATEVYLNSSATVYGWDGRLTFYSDSYLPREGLRPSNFWDIADFNWPDYRVKIKIENEANFSDLHSTNTCPSAHSCKLNIINLHLYRDDPNTLLKMEQ
jgi:hypothetical protein